MNELQKIIVLGAGWCGGGIANIFPEPKKPREITCADIAALEAAKAKRERKAGILRGAR